MHSHSHAVSRYLPTYLPTRTLSWLPAVQQSTTAIHSLGPMTARCRASRDPPTTSLNPGFLHCGGKWAHRAVLYTVQALVQYCCRWVDARVPGRVALAAPSRSCLQSHFHISLYPPLIILFNGSGRGGMYSRYHRLDKARVGLSLYILLHLALPRVFLVLVCETGVVSSWMGV